MEYEQNKELKDKVKIGLEIHGYIHLDNQRKLFCNCKIDKHAEPNTNICPICTAMPGAKPMPTNSEAVEKVIKIALMLNCKVNKKLMFQRKHYDWPDLPSGYQRTMSGSYSLPVGLNGKFLGIRIRELHLEEDPAKWDPETGFIDYNRSGFPLVEIVTEPDFYDPEFVKQWLKSLMITLKYVDALDIDAGIKADVNISVEPNFKRVEIKNVNSLSSIVNAIKYEIKRLNKEKPSKEETRRFNKNLNVTEFMRYKENLAQYLFIPEPDLPIVHITEEEVINLESNLPEKPDVKYKRYLGLGIDKERSFILCSDPFISEIFDYVFDIGKDIALNGVVKELIKAIHKNKIESSDLEINKNVFKKLLKLFKENKITDVVLRKLINEMILNKDSFENIEIEDYLKQNDLLSMNDSNELNKICEETIKENSKAVNDYLNGNENAINFLIGQIMKKTKGKANQKIVKEILIKLITN